MSRLRDLDDTAQDRNPVNVAPESKGMLDVSGLLDPSPPLIPRLGGQEMELESPATRTETPQEADSPRRDAETEGGDSELTNLRGGSGSQYSDDNSVNSTTQQLAGLLHSNPNSPSPRSQYVGHPGRANTRTDDYYPDHANTYPYQPMPMPMQMRTDGRTPAPPYDYPPLATYDPMSHLSYTDGSSSSQPTPQPQQQPFHSHPLPHPHGPTGINMPWEYQYQPPTPLQHHATGHIDRHGQHTMYPSGYPDPNTNPTSPSNQMPSVPAPGSGPSHHPIQHQLQHQHQHQHQHHPHPHTHHPHAQHQRQHQHNQDQIPYQTFPLVRDPYSNHPPGGYAYSDPQGHTQSRYLPSGGSNYDPPSSSASGSATGSGSGQGHYKERGTSFDSATPAKKVITTSRLGLDPAAKQERRREQNRVAQRAFRARAKIREQERSDDYDDDNQNEDVFEAR